MQPFVMTKHAIERALDMNVEGDEIREAFENPERIYWSPRHDSWNYQRGRVCLGVKEAEGQHLILTVLWATDEAWVEDADLAPIAPGRELRGVAKVLAAQRGRR